MSFFFSSFSTSDTFNSKLWVVSDCLILTFKLKGCFIWNFAICWWSAAQRSGLQEHNTSPLCSDPACPPPPPHLHICPSWWQMFQNYKVGNRHFQVDRITGSCNPVNMHTACVLQFCTACLVLTETLFLSVQSWFDIHPLAASLN